MLAGVFLFVMTSESLAARYSPAEISLEGKKVLECGGGDNGHPDADEVWATLKTRQFRPAAHFPILQIPDDAKEFIINEDPPRGDVGKISIDVLFGGHSQTRSLRIIRVPKDKFGHEWMIDPKAVDEMYDWRTITRDQAGYLRHPEKIGRAETAAYVKAQVVIATPPAGSSVSIEETQQKKQTASSGVPVGIAHQQKQTASWFMPLLVGVFIGVALTSMISWLRRPKPSSLPPDSK
jgi:hypothetical protein